MRPIKAACLGTATLVTLLTCTSVAGAATDTGSAQARDKGRTITVVAVVQEVKRFPVPPVVTGSPKQGDQVVVRSLLFDEEDHQIGETHGSCVTTRGGANEAEQCLVTYILPGGQLTTQGVYFNYLDQGPFDSAITGGTGKYEKARGSVHSITTSPDPVTRRFTIHLV
ncbi:allene oxide cyclase barrel-like domain-containing protein [Streptomyces sp. NPDC004126]|uniref:allene oxide cyclase barrel-like domain-containing protein n=1 Tax=Streptomyces sp. NPDC004126 TaxID=3390695 RepID=UPI003D016CF1